MNAVEPLRGARPGAGAVWNPPMRHELESDGLKPSSNSTPADQVWTTAEAALFLRIAPKTLRNWRCAGRGPAYEVRQGHRGVLYRPAVVQAWQKTNTRVVDPEKRLRAARRGI
ncbi:helix-turn-helix domain-containing protein [Streptomyces sp. NPDC056144]|uniref:helix-turn-helix domain-containing protein n=1 Tax=unclassified Streptomyces TaxID=2593676 RepID=UPI0035DB844C